MPSARRETNIISRTESASIALPIIMNGRNLPILVLVLSIIPPRIGSVMPSNTRIKGANKLAKVLTPIASTPDITTPPIAVPTLPVRARTAQYTK